MGQKLCLDGTSTRPLGSLANQSTHSQNVILYYKVMYNIAIRAAMVNRNISYPRFRTRGSVSVRFFQISVRFRFVFFLTINVVTTDILSGKSYKI